MSVQDWTCGTCGVAHRNSGCAVGGNSPLRAMDTSKPLPADDRDEQIRLLLLQLGEERERCAKVADDFGAKAGNDAAGGMAHIIAQEIRAGITKKPLSDLGLDVATYEAAKREQAEGKRVPIDDVIKGLPEKRKCEHDWELIKSHGPWPESNRCKKCGASE